VEPLLNIGVRAARRGAAILLRHIERVNDLEITVKGNRDFVSEVDRASERAIIETIRSVHPRHAILSEEAGALTGEGVRWIVDPLGGTNNYLHALPHFSISIAVEVRGKLQHGIVYDPLREELFVGTRGGGAMLNNRRIRVSRRTRLEDALVAVGFAPRAAENVPSLQRAYLAIHEWLTDHGTVRHTGSAALDLAYVAAGRLDGFFQLGLSIWDMAAGSLLVREAGGMVADPGGGEQFLTTGEIVATCPPMFRPLLRAVHNGVRVESDRADEGTGTPR